MVSSPTHAVTDRRLGERQRLDHDPRRVLFILMAVALVYFLAQLLLSGIDRFTALDEAVYLTEVQRGVPGVAFASHRSRGASWLVWPTAGVGAPVLVTRIWLASVSSIGLVVAFRPWIRSVGWGAPLAAGLFAGSWVALLFGNEIESSLFAALAVVAAFGLAVQPPGSGRRVTQLLGIGLAMAVLALFRPTDVAWAGLAMAACLPIIHGWRGFVSLVAAGVGAIVGLIPWVIEAILRFGGPVRRFNAVKSATLGGGVEGGGPLLTVRQYLSLADGPRALTSGSPPEAFTNPEVSTTVLVGAVVVLGAVVYGTLRPRHRTGGAVRTAAVGGLLFMLAYVTLTGAVHVRFLLPAWGLAAIPVAEAVLRLIRRGGPLVLAAVVAVLGVWLVGQLVTLRTEAAGLVSYRGDVRRLGTAVARMVEDPCYIYAEREYPNIALGTGCRTEPFTPGEDRGFRRDPQDLADDGVHVYGLLREPAPPFAEWPSRPVADQDWGYRLYEWPAGDG